MSISFTADVVEGLSPLRVQFSSQEDEVANPVGYLWRFGDGFTSIDKNPQHIYKMPGVYVVKLTVTFDDATTVSETKLSYIMATEPANSEIYSVTSTNKSFRYGVRKEQGYGFSENTGSAFPFPEVGCGNINILDTYKQFRNLIYDVNTGHLFDITTRDGSSTTGDVKVYRDAANVSGIGGTDILPSVKFKEDRGEMEHYYITNQNNHIYLRPNNEDNRGATNYTDAGFPSGLTADVSMFADGEQTTEKAKAEDIVFPKNDISFDKKITAHRLQTEASFTTSDFKLVGRTQYYKTSDLPDGGDTQLMNESTNQVDIGSDMTQWLTRGSTPLLNRITGESITGTTTSTDGPDTYTDSAMVIDTNIDLGNDSITSGRIQLWAKASGDYVEYFNNVNSITLTNVGTQGSWDLLKYEGAIASGLTLVSGSVFDYRLYDTTLSSTEETYYITDIQRNSGDTCLPWY